MSPGEGTVREHESEHRCAVFTHNKSGKGQIPLRYPARDKLAISSRAGRRPTSELDSVMDIWPEPVCDQVRANSTCRDSSNLSATGRKPGLRPGLRPG